MLISLINSLTKISTITFEHMKLTITPGKCKERAARMRKEETKPRKTRGNMKWHAAILADT